MLDELDAWWRAANYLTVGQIYLMANPLLREPLAPAHIKPRLLGHWGTSPGLSFLFAHMNRLIRATDQEAIYIAGPGHGGPAVVAASWLEGSWTEAYPDVARDGAGMLTLFRRFSTPGGFASHAGPFVPGSIHEGGELGYSLLHAFGAVFDNPGLLAACVVGDGEAETAALEGSWKGVHFLDPRRDGAVLPILHLNGWKIAGPTVLARSSDESIASLLRGHGWDPLFFDTQDSGGAGDAGGGQDNAAVHARFAALLDRAHARILEIQASARARGAKPPAGPPAWPAIVFRSPKGWTGPREVDGKRTEGTFRSHQVPLAGVRDNAAHLAQLEAWMRSYRPEDLFDASGRPVQQVLAGVPREGRRMSASPHANGGLLLRPLDLPAWRQHALPVARPGCERRESTRALGKFLRDTFRGNAASANFRLFCPDETHSNRLDDVFEIETRCLVAASHPDDEHISPGGRVMEVLSEHCAEGWLEGYLLTGRHGLFATYEAFAMVADSMITQHVKWIESCAELSWRAPISSLNLLLTSTCWRNDHNGFSHQGPGLIDTILSKRGTVSRVYLPPDANTLLAVADHCLRSRDYVNLIVVDKQPQLQYLDADAAARHCEQGAGIWDWAGTPASGAAPDVVLACAGDIATQETLAAAELLRRGLPALRIRVVNIVDLMVLPPPDRHPHGFAPERFEAVFTADRPVIFAFHGYPGAVHQLVHGRPDAGRFHVRGFVEEGTTTTPFDMVVKNRTSRVHLAAEAVRRARERGCVLPEADRFLEAGEDLLRRHDAWVRSKFEDLPEIACWTFGEVRP